MKTNFVCALILGLFGVASANAKSLPMCRDFNDPNKLDVVFAPVNFESLKDFEKVINEHIDYKGKRRGLLFFEPFKSARKKFKFWKTDLIPSDLEKDFISQRCVYGKNPSLFSCARQIFMWFYRSHCRYDKAIIIFNNAKVERNTWGGWAESVGGNMAVTLAYEPRGYESLGYARTVHEFAHLLGLYDEEVSDTRATQNLETVPNCDEVGCKKWCKDFKRIPESEAYKMCKDLPRAFCWTHPDCVWLTQMDPYYLTQCIPKNDRENIGIDCLPGTGCYHNCTGTGAWRPADFIKVGPNANKASSLMFNLNAFGFDAVDTRFLKQALDKYK